MDVLWEAITDGEIRAKYNFGVETRSDWTPGSRYEGVHPGAGNLPEAVARGAASLQATGLAARQIAVLTDGQRTAWQDPVQVRDVPVLVYAPDAPGKVPAAKSSPTRSKADNRWAKSSFGSPL